MTMNLYENANELICKMSMNLYVNRVLYLLARNYEFYMLERNSFALAHIELNNKL